MASRRDEDFYSSLAAGAGDDSDFSEADPTALAKSLRGLDDMDDDILGSLTAKKSLSSTAPVKSSVTPKKNVGPADSKRPAFNIDDIMGESNDDRHDSFTTNRPKTTDDTKKSSLSSDLFTGTATKARPATTEQPKKATKKFDFGDFDEDDPLAGLDLSDEDEKPKKKPSPKANPVPAPSANPAISVSEPVLPPANTSQQLQTETPTTNSIDTRPVTRSGNRQADETDLLPVKTRSKLKQNDSDEGSNWDESSEGSADKTMKSAAVKAPAKTKPAPKKDEVTFSDDEDLDLGLDDSPVKPKDEVKKSGGFSDSLFGKSGAIEKHLDRPGTGGSGSRTYTLDSAPPSKYEASESSAVSRKKLSDDDEDVFGSYAPSALSSRPGTGRSVRFEDEGMSDNRPATAGAVPKASSDDWLGLGAGPSQKRPLGLASTTDFSGKLDDDWLGMAAGSSRPKTAPEKVIDKKPPRTPVKKTPPASSTSKPADDWLSELTAKVDNETDATINQKILSRQSSAEITSRRSSLDSAGTSSRRPSLTKQKSSADNWLGLGDEASTQSPSRSLTSAPAKKSSPLPLSKTSSPLTVTASAPDADWLGIEADPVSKDSDTEQWIKAAKMRKANQQNDQTSQPGLKPATQISKENADEHSLDILRDDRQLTTAAKPTSDDMNRSKLGQSASSSATKKQAVISGLFDDDFDKTPDISSQQPIRSVSVKSTLPKAFPSAVPSSPKPQPVIQPLFNNAVPVDAGSTVMDSGAWNREQEDLMMQHQTQMEQMQQQFQQMMDLRRQQQQATLEQQRKVAEETFKLQQQHIATSMSSTGPSPVFPVGLSPIKQSEMQLNNVELEGKVRRLEHEKQHLESLILSMKQRNQEEITAVETSSKARIAVIEETYQRREFRLREEIEQLTSESLTKLRLVEEEKVSLLSAQYRKVDELEQRRSTEMEQVRQQHRQQLDTLKTDHQQALERVRKSKEQELETLLANQSNPNSLQFLMEQMKQNAAGLTQVQFSVSKNHQVTLDEREMAMNSRDQQLKVLQECLMRQQDENDKERCRLQELMAKMEIQLREQERQLHQEKWSVSQERSKLAALQTAVEQERSLLTDQLTQERAELSRAKDAFLSEQRQAMVQLADERRLLSEERAQLTISQRMHSEQERAESLKQTQGSARYEGLIKTLEHERELLSQRSRSVAEEEKKMAAETATLQQERESVKQERERLAELATKIKSETERVETFSKDCLDREKMGTEALHVARQIETSNQSRLTEISDRLGELKAAEKHGAEERLQLARERKQIESLKSMQLCAGCKQPISRNPYFSLSTPALRSRTVSPSLRSRAVSPSSIGIVLPQQLDITDPSILKYKIQADQDQDFLNDESMYLQALKYSPYHKQ